MVAYRFLGSSGFKVSEITYGNWVTHGSQIDDEAAIATVHAALEHGITTFDTADVYANTRAEVVLGEALKGQRRDTLELLTKVYFPTGAKGPNNTGLSRKHIRDSVDGSLRRLGTDYIDLYQAHRFDHQTPLEETFQAFADLVRQGKVLYIGVSEWTADQLRAGHALAKDLGIQLVSNQPQYSALWRVIEDRVVPTSEELGISQVVWSPLAQGVLTGKYLPGEAPPADSRAANERSSDNVDEKYLRDEVLTAVQRLKPIAQEAGLTMPQLGIAWVLQNPNVSAALVGASRPDQLGDTVKASGVTLDPEVLAAIDTALEGVVERDPEQTESSSPKRRLV